MKLTILQVLKIATEPITPRGYDELLKEFKYLKDVEKPRANVEKQVAAALGDRSENGDYQAAKEKLRHIDKRLFYLNSMIEKSQIIDPSKSSHTRVQFGSTVEIVDLLLDVPLHVTICGVLEMEVENSLISIHAPLSKALLGKSVDDEIRVVLPKGVKEYEIVNIKYIDIYELKKEIKSEKEYGFK